MNGNSEKINKNDLGRYMSADVRRAVRQRDGSGCVVCGSYFYHYDHLGTEFKDAYIHDPEKIVLLCGGCHDRKNRSSLSTETIQNAARSPKCKQKSFSWGPLDLGVEHPTVSMGTITAKRVNTLIKVEGEELFSISPPLEAGEPFRINATLYDRQGNLVVRIVENEVRVLTTSWDSEVVGPRIKIRSGLGIFEVVLRVEPPRAIVIERLNMVYREFSIKCKEGAPTVIEHGGRAISADSAELEGCDVALEVKDGALLVGSGGGSITIRNLSFAEPSFSGGLLGSSKLSVSGKAKQGRNEMCECMSGKKFKHCHGSI